MKMVAGKLGRMVAAIFIVSFLTFALAKALPGDPALIVLGTSSGTMIPCATNPGPSTANDSSVADCRGIPHSKLHPARRRRPGPAGAEVRRRPVRARPRPVPAPAPPRPAHPPAVRPVGGRGAPRRLRHHLRRRPRAGQPPDRPGPPRHHRADDPGRGGGAAVRHPARRLQRLPREQAGRQGRHRVLVPRARDPQLRAGHLPGAVLRGGTRLAAPALHTRGARTPSRTSSRSSSPSSPWPPAPSRCSPGCCAAT